MELYNSTLYNYQAIINGVSYDLKSRSSIFFDCENNASVELKCLNKSFVHIDWISIITMHMLFGSSTITGIYANYSFVIKDAGVDKIKLSYNDWSLRDQIEIKACYADSNIYDEKYTLPSLEKVRKKHKMFHSLISNALPIGLILLILSITSKSHVLFIALFAIWLLAFELPSLKEMKRFKDTVKPDYINKKMCEYASERRHNGIAFCEDTSKTAKLVDKVFSKMFKPNEDKK